MAVDIYIKNNNYPYFDKDEIDISDDLEIFLQQLEMIITTPKGSLLGEPDFGVDLESYLWSFYKGSSGIQQEINQQINTYIQPRLALSINYEISVNFLKGEVWDTIIVDVLIDGNKVAGYAVTP